MILAQPTPAAFCPMIYSPASSSIVLVNTANSPAYLQETIQTFTWSGSSWALSNSGLSNNPLPLRTDTSGAYDTTGSQVIIFGGRGQPGLDFLNDVQGYASGAWTSLIPNYNSYGLMTDGYYGLNIRARSYMFGLSTGVLLHGGFDRHYIYQDSYLFASNAWTTLSPTTVPPIRVGASAASNGTTTAVLAMGANESTLLSDVWIYTTGSNNWAQLTTNTPAPRTRKDATLCYYTTGSYFLFGGGQDSSGRCLGDWWSLSISGTVGTWTQLNPSNTPSRRIGMSAAFDTSSSQLILWGGEDNWNQYCDTWQWNGSTFILLSNPI